MVRAPDSLLKGRWFESRQERRENYPLQGQFSVPTLISVSVPPPCYRSHFEGGRLQVTTHAAYVTGFAGSDVIGCMSVWCQQNVSRRQQFYDQPCKDQERCNYTTWEYIQTAL